MITSFIGWVKGLSVAGKVALAVAGFGAVGVVATPPSAPPTEQNTQKAVETPSPTTETITDTQSIPFNKLSIDTVRLNQGDSKITTVGIDGEKKITYRVASINGVETSREKISEEVTKDPVDEVTSVGVYIEPTPQPQNNCDPNYSPCVPLVSYDLDCPDIGFSVNVLGSDPHRFDREGDGYGCESY